jgi:hypothetical protein
MKRKPKPKMVKAWGWSWFGTPEFHGINVMCNCTKAHAVKHSKYVAKTYRVSIGPVVRIEVPAPREVKP